MEYGTGYVTLSCINFLKFSSIIIKSIMLDYVEWNILQKEEQ